MPEGFEQVGRGGGSVSSGRGGTYFPARSWAAAVFKMAPDVFDRVEVRRVGRQPFEVQALVTGTFREMV